MASPVWHFLNGVPVIPVAQIGTMLAGDGSASAPSYSFASEAALGAYRVSSGFMGFAAGSAGVFGFLNSGSAGVQLASAIPLSWSSGVLGSASDVLLSRGAANRLDLASGDSLYLVAGGLGVGTAPGSSGLAVSGTTTTTVSYILGSGAGTATSAVKIIKKVTGIADAAATDVITVTVPNAAHAATILVTFLSSNGSTDAFESSRVATGSVVLARTSGVATVAAVSTLEAAQIATVGSGATHTLAYGVSAISGLASATQTFTIQVTINDSGNVGSNQCVVVAEVINAESTGVTIS